MFMKISNSLVDMSNLSKPANTLIKKISSAAGVLFEPKHIKRIAEAKAEVARIEVESQIEITDLKRRAMRRWIEEEAQQQENMESITAKALPQLNENAKPDSIENDWIVNFFDKSRIVSDSEMQNLWSRVLAGQANVPGTYSKRTVNFLSDLDKVEAELFTKLCGFCWFVGEFVPLVFDSEEEIYKANDINFVNLSHLDSIGLIQFDATGLSGFINQKIPKVYTVSYYNNMLNLEMPQDVDNDLPVGQVLFTRIGKELLPICRSRPVTGFLDYVKDKWKEYLPKSETES